MKPKISVIIPVYNAEATLRRCVDSVLSQTFTDFECLLIKDGSKDRSGEICDEYAAKDSGKCISQIAFNMKVCMAEVTL